MEMVKLYGMMGNNIQEVIKMVRNKDMVFIIILMEKFMKDNGKMVNNMVMVS
jgi:hypothetical protein